MTIKIFNENFVKQFALQKTLRFELIPVPETRNKMSENLQYDEDLQTFLKDQEIEDAYQTLKPVFDKIHEEFITRSLENDEAKKIDFSKYFELKGDLQIFKAKKKNLNKKTQKSDIEKVDKEIEQKSKEIEVEEKKLRGEIVKLYEIVGESFKQTVSTNEKGKEIFKEKSFKALTESGILEYIKINIDRFVAMNLETQNGKKIEKIDLEKALINGTKDDKSKDKGIIEKFFTYFSGFNQNRENYYSADDKSTAVSNRIVNENLPKFVDNILLFEKQKYEYVKIFEELKKANKELKIKNKDGTEKIVNQFWGGSLYY